MAMRDTFEFNFLRALEVFAVVVETRHITEAGAMLGMTQSAVSQHLKNLETALGTTLLDRRLRPFELTKAGIALHRRATAILGEVEQLQVDVRRADLAPLPLLRVALLASIATTLAPALAGLARTRFRIPEISLYAGLLSDHQHLLRSRRADLAVTSDALFDLEGLTRHPILTESFLLVTPKSYRGPIDDLSRLAKTLPLVRFARETQVGIRTDQHLRRVRLELPRAIEGDRSSVVMAPVAAGLGFALLTPTLLIDGLAENMPIAIHELPLPRFSREITLVARERELDDLPAAFAEQCAVTLSTSISKRFPELPPGSFSIAGPAISRATAG
ncbi:MAG: LysR family transcriptional regulator [Pseudomonadota bacterium]